MGSPSQTLSTSGKNEGNGLVDEDRVGQAHVADGIEEADHRGEPHEARGTDARGNGACGAPPCPPRAEPGQQDQKAHRVSEEDHHGRRQLAGGRLDRRTHAREEQRGQEHEDGAPTEVLGRGASRHARIIRAQAPAPASAAGFACALARGTLRPMFVRRSEAVVEHPEPGVTRQVLGNDSELMMVRVTFVKGRRGLPPPPPAPPGELRRAGRLRGPGGRRRPQVLREGDCYFVPPDVPHGVTALEDAALVDVFAPARLDFLSR